MSVFGPPFRSRARLAAVLEKFEDCDRPRHPRAVKGPVEEARKGEKARRRADEGGFMLEGARVWMWKERREGADMEGVSVWMRKALVVDMEEMAGGYGHGRYECMDMEVTSVWIWKARVWFAREYAATCDTVRIGKFSSAVAERERVIT